MKKIKLYNNLRKSYLLFLALLTIVSVFVIIYTGEAIRYGTLFPPLVRSIGYSIATLIFLPFYMSEGLSIGYVISDEGIGRVKHTKKGWLYKAYVAWEDVVAINYKKSMLFGGKHLEIHSSKNACRRKKILLIDKDQRDFNEIVSIVCEKTNLQLN